MERSNHGCEFVWIFQQRVVLHIFGSSSTLMQNGRNNFGALNVCSSRILRNESMFMFMCNLGMNIPRHITLARVFEASRRQVKWKREKTIK